MIRTEMSPDGEPVALKSGRTGYVRKVIAFWPAVRCWDVLVFDPDHEGVPCHGFAHETNLRNAQVRGMSRGAAPWKEVTL